MTLDEFKRMAESSDILIRCDTVKQRRGVIELFEECGIEIHSATRTYLHPNGDNDTMYMHPGMRPGREYVVCFRNYLQAKDYVSNAFKYEDVEALIENPAPLDDRSDAEFANDFASLLG